MKQHYSGFLFRFLPAVMVLAFALMCVSVSVPARAQEQPEAGKTTDISAPAVDDGQKDEVASDEAVFAKDAAAAKAESKKDVELDSLRGLPYLTIEDTLRYKRQLMGEVEPLKPDVSLMFTSWEHALLREMKKKVAVTRPANPGEMTSETDDGKPRAKGIREISLGGIVFAGKDDWTIWLNNQRVTPNAIPKEILDMRVTNDYVEMKWFDGYTNLVFPLRLRPHQRFNLDNRIFLPGTTAGSL